MDLPLVDFWPFLIQSSFCLFLDSWRSQETKSLLKITSSDPISITTPVAPTIVQDEEEDIEELNLEEEARLNLAFLISGKEKKWCNDV